MCKPLPSLLANYGIFQNGSRCTRHADYVDLIAFQTSDPIAENVKSEQDSLRTNSRSMGKTRYIHAVKRKRRFRIAFAIQIARPIFISSDIYFRHGLPTTNTIKYKPTSAIVFNTPLTIYLLPFLYFFNNCTTFYVHTRSIIVWTA